MTEEEKKKMQELEATNAKLLKEKADADAKAAELAKEIETQKGIIEQKSRDITEARHKYKKLSEMTQEELDAMSEKEKELQRRQEEHEANLKNFETKQAETLAKEVGARKAAAIKKLAGDNPELAKKVEDNFGLIKDSDKAQTEEEISKLVGTAWNMLGEEKPNPMGNVFDNDGGAPADSLKTSTPENRLNDIAASIGLPTAVEGGGNAGAGAQ